MAKEDSVTKKMAQLIRQGAILTQYTCPVCGTPLLKLKSGNYYCANCDREVVVVKSEEEEREVNIKYGLINVRDVVFSKIMELSKELPKASDIDEVNHYAVTLTNLLNALSMINKLINEQGKQVK
ncbi:Sjogren's syndrome/scleroderma autoantigen 1 family protein [Caldivirga maquilingensis]|uniref:Sjogrens syndrome scleroderma autoantigen 1 n=1 Tax=Caldivirga maquilingensis (strain ATCC 700844 / DSM 13496 / JCM 10307 / IC-167) TaxID=397948 RepID=A8MA11_CALMQ|nr:Sjogren's syndrome/scleroderma autoantigen 1 family protein [Caldivirga maquilingensis]ABW02482.1 Sjogrens syndrome scleroderma autoantigen 1 [Caldivirga maquilingensis IC-167]